MRRKPQKKTKTNYQQQLRNKLERFHSNKFSILYSLRIDFCVFNTQQMHHDHEKIAIVNPTKNEKINNYLKTE